MMLLDILKPTYGPGLPNICAAAVAALYAALRPVLAEVAEVDAQVTALAAWLRCGRGEAVRAALFWLAIQSVVAGEPRQRRINMVIISSALAFPGTTVKASEISFPGDLSGCVSYVGHPATKGLLEALGATSMPSGSKWGGPEVGESYLAVPLASPASREGGYTKDVAIESVAELKAVLLIRVA